MARRDMASRIIAAPHERVYAALIDPGALVEWLPPGDMTGTFERFDARPGGSYRMVLTYPSASGPQGKSTPDTDVIEARIIDLVPHVRIACAVDFDSDDPLYAGTMAMTWEVSQVEGGTRVDITADHVPDGVSEEDHIAGMTSSLEKLARYLEE